MGGLFVLSDTLGSVYLDADVNESDELNATTTHESTAKTMKRYPDPKQRQDRGR